MSHSSSQLYTSSAALSPISDGQVLILTFPNNRSAKKNDDFIHILSLLLSAICPMICYMHALSRSFVPLLSTKVIIRVLPVEICLHKDCEHWYILLPAILHPPFRCDNRQSNKLLFLRLCQHLKSSISKSLYSQHFSPRRYGSH